MPRVTLSLTDAEYGAVSEAIRYAQQTAHEGSGRHSAPLSRVQRKLGDEVGCGDGDEPFGWRA